MRAKVRRLCQHYADRFKIAKWLFCVCRTKKDARGVFLNSKVVLEIYRRSKEER